MTIGDLMEELKGDARKDVEAILKELQIKYSKDQLYNYLFEYGYQMYNYGHDNLKGKQPFIKERRGFIIKSFHDIKAYELYTELYGMMEDGYVPNRMVFDADKVSRVISKDFNKYYNRGAIK